MVYEWNETSIAYQELGRNGQGRYLRRWARRLRMEGIPPADTIFIAYVSFGVDLQRQQMGVEVIVTNDRKLAATIRSQLTRLHDQFV